MAAKRTPPAQQKPPAWIRPQLALLVKEAPAGPEWLHEIKYDGYRLHARIGGDDIALLTRSGLDWTHKYPSIAEGPSALGLGSAYLDGELCALNEDGTTSFSGMQAATDTVGAAELVYFAFDLLFADGASIADRPLFERKARLDLLLAGAAERSGTAITSSATSRGFARPLAKLGRRPSSRSGWMRRTSLATAASGASRNA